MTLKIEIFFFVLSLLYCIKNLINFITILKEETPTPMDISKTESVLLYFSITYVISTIIILFI